VASLTLCLCVHALKGKRLELSAPNFVHVVLYGKTSAWIDPEVKRSNVKVSQRVMECAAGVGLCVDMTA